MPEHCCSNITARRFSENQGLIATIKLIHINELSLSKVCPALLALIVCCRHATSIQEDIKLVECQQAGVCVTSRVKAAVAARLERKQLIKAAVDMLQQYASMVG